jgi:nucleoside-diphosphate-sugar epimerase
MLKVLITGANSFVGTNFIKYSKYSNTEEVSLLDVVPEKINFEKYDVVLHLAAIVHQSKRISESEYFDVNRDLSLRVANCAKKAGIRQFIFISTLKVYGSLLPETALRNESSICYPEGGYGKSKYEAEIALKKLVDPGFTVAIVRTPLVYGEGAKANMLSMIKLIDHFCILPFAKIYNKRNFTYVGNLVAFIDRIIEIRASGVYIAMDDNAISTTELVNYISNYLNKKVILVKFPKIFIRLGCYFYPGIFERLYGSLEFENSRTRKSLDFTTPFTTEEGIRRMVLAYRHREVNNNTGTIENLSGK